MSLDVYVVSGDEQAAAIESVPDKTTKFLGEKEDTAAVRIQDMLEAVSASVSKRITHTSKLTIELTGTVALKGKGGMKFLLFDIGGDAARSSAMKVVLETTIVPEDDS